MPPQIEVEVHISSDSSLTIVGLAEAAVRGK